MFKNEFVYFFYPKKVNGYEKIKYSIEWKIFYILSRYYFILKVCFSIFFLVILEMFHPEKKAKNPY